MNLTRRLIEGSYLEDLRKQPEAIRDTARLLADASVNELRAQCLSGAFDRIILTGMGSSFHALHAFAPRLGPLTLPVATLETAELIHAQRRQLTPRTLVLAVSQSGASVEIIRLLDTLPRGTRLVAVTNTPDSPLARNAHLCLVTRAGPEHTVTCKTYLATIATLIWLAEALQDADPGETVCLLSRSADATADYLARWRHHVEDLAETLSGIHQLYVLGRGCSLAAAGTAGLIIKEAACFPTEGMSSAAFRHGPIEMVSPQTGILILEGTRDLAPLNHNLLKDLQALGASAHLIGQQTHSAALRLPVVDELLLPIVEILPLQMASLALAALQGHEAGRFTKASKTTHTE